MATKVEIKTTIPQELHLRFINVLPMHGALTWAMKTILEELVNTLEAQPTLQQQIIHSISNTTNKKGQ